MALDDFAPSNGAPRQLPLPKLRTAEGENRFDFPVVVMQLEKDRSEHRQRRAGDAPSAAAAAKPVEPLVEKLDESVLSAPRAVEPKPPPVLASAEPQAAPPQRSRRSSRVVAALGRSRGLIALPVLVQLAAMGWVWRSEQDFRGDMHSEIATRLQPVVRLSLAHTNEAQTRAPDETELAALFIQRRALDRAAETRVASLAVQARAELGPASIPKRGDTP